MSDLVSQRQLDQRVSIVVNNYNYTGYLRSAIESALNQTYPHTEVVVVDDGSTDDSRAIIKSYGSRIVPVLKENGGQGSAFNAGFAVAKGDFILFLDADDFLEPCCVAKCVELAERFAGEFSRIAYGLYLVDAGGSRVGLLPNPVHLMEKGDLLKKLNEEQLLSIHPTSGNFFKRSALAKILPMPAGEFRICADVYLIYLTAQWGEVLLLPERLASYRIHGKNHFWTENKYEPTNLPRLAADLNMLQSVLKRTRLFNDDKQIANMILHNVSQSAVLLYRVKYRQMSNNELVTLWGIHFWQLLKNYIFSRSDGRAARLLRSGLFLITPSDCLVRILRYPSLRRFYPR